MSWPKATKVEADLGKGLTRSFFKFPPKPAHPLAASDCRRQRQFHLRASASASAKIATHYFLCNGRASTGDIPQLDSFAQQSTKRPHLNPYPPNLFFNGEGL
jgi:hypothetical protein